MPSFGPCTVCGADAVVPLVDDGRMRHVEVMLCRGCAREVIEHMWEEVREMVRDSGELEAQP